MHHLRSPLLAASTAALLGLLAPLAAAPHAAAQDAKQANYDETKIGDFTLPPLLVNKAGEKVTTAEQWRTQRRGEIMALFEGHVYGRTPPKPADITFTTTATKPDALGGLATRILAHVALKDHPQWPGMDVMIYVPNAANAKPVPVFVGLSFGGNHAVTTETDVPLSTRWFREDKQRGTPGNRASEASRGGESSRWPLTMILQRGYAVATAYYGDMEPDHAEGWRDSLRAALHPAGAKAEWKPDDWGAIGAWAWGESRILDLCETLPTINAKHAITIGHSRLGKASLWAGAQDERFGIVISNNSGEGGAALSRRYFGETTKRITTSFPHWFAPRYSEYADNAAANPVDMHMLIALMAPRPVYIASAVEDAWADPKGEFLSGKIAGDEVYPLFGLRGVNTADWPTIDTPVGDRVGYHNRTGKHDVTDYDWAQYLSFADRHFGAAK